MSLEKFQATDAWRDILKKHLLTKRKPIVVPAVPLVPKRLSFELSEDLQVILKDKNIPSGCGRKMPRVRNPDENKENAEERVHYNTPTKAKLLHKVDTTMMEDPTDVFQITNTSFETLEDMCEKTASDPDSTLFRYLNHEPAPVMHTREVRRNHSYDEEADALQRLLDELNVEETEKRMRAQTSPNDTQLDDIEEPSKFWENTLTAETLQSISPVKMVGLMRQSTIMEECSDVSGSEASSTSYQSAMKTGWSSETTDCYDTANDTATCSERKAEKKVSNNSSGASSTSELFQQRHSRQKFFEYQKNDRKSLHLIDLETTIQLNSPDPIPDSPESPEPEEISKCSNDSFEKPESSPEPLKCSPESTQLSEPESSRDLYESSREITQLTESDRTSSSIIELSDDESAECDKILQKIDQLEADSVLNRSFTIKSEQKADDEKSIHFNDTMEEVEFMMKKGMQYMEAAKDKPSPAKSHLTPAKKAERYRSPSPMLSSPITPKTVIAKPKPVNNHTLNIKPFPKLDIFKKPHGSNLRAPTVQNKFISATKKQQYAHVVSPIGAYIKKTPTTPLISNIKPVSSDSTVTSKAFKQLEYNSRVIPKNTGPITSEKKEYVCSLPKKAYISAEYQHITDKRTPRVIPGGPKIQCYLQPSLVPAVVRHEGKLKMTPNMRSSSVEPPSPRRTDDSLAGLSMISGDVSVYTIKDAQKF